MADKTWAEKTAEFKAQSVSILNSEAAAVWVACALDGEGLVGIYKAKALTQSGFGYSAKIVVSNTCTAFLAEFVRLIGGGEIRSKPKVTGNKQGYYVQVPGKLVIPVLTAVMPYLVIKKKQALMVLAFRKLVEKSSWHGCTNHEAYDRIYQECKALNSRGDQS